MFEKKQILTIANAVTVAGFTLTVVGSWHMNEVWGVVVVGIGRTFDIVDGMIARKLHQDGAFGAMLDAVADKFGILAIIIAQWYFGITPILLLLSIILLNLANTYTAYLITQVKHNLTIRPSESGKHAIFLQNVSLGAFALAYIIDNHPVKLTLQGLGLITGISGVFILGVPATIGYFKTARSLKKN